MEYVKSAIKKNGKENGYKSYDFIFENVEGEKIGWCHWEGDVIHLLNKKDYGMNIDCITTNSWCSLENYKEFLEEQE